MRRILGPISAATIKLVFVLFLGGTLTACGANLATVIRAKDAVPTIQTPTPQSATQSSAGSSATLPGVPTPTTVPAVLTPVNSTTQSAIQSVIQKADSEQVDAFARHDPTLMQDTAAAGYYSQLIQINSDLASNGVSAIKLLNLEWGPIGQVDASHAEATTFETWQTSYTDGHTEVQQRDRNVYTLIQENGSWKIQTDDHPDDAQNQSSGGGTPGTPASGASTSGTPTTSLSPTSLAAATNPDQSRNWAGYTAEGGSFTAVTGTWSVPLVTAPTGTNTTTTGRSGSFAGDATWVGIGGVNGRDLIQAGTQAEVVGSGETRYEAWIEMLPAESQTIPLTVSPGDSITVSITQDAAGKWTVLSKNNTTGKSYQAQETYTSTLSSAEWIEEAPSGGRRLVPLDNFGTVQFSGGSTVKNGKTMSIAQAGGKPIAITGRGGQTSASPSALGKDGSSFSVTRG